MTLNTVLKRTIMVLILMPPAVPVGLAPINIKIHRKSRVSSEIEARSTVANPEVLAAVELKTELENFSIKFKFFNVPLYSKAKKPIVPNATKNKDPKMAILELIERFFSLILDFTKFNISLITTKPNPPSKVKALIV